MTIIYKETTSALSFKVINHTSYIKLTSAHVSEYLKFDFDKRIFPYNLGGGVAVSL